MINNKVVIILGPTGVGKSSISIDLAQELNGEIISADSIQIYKGLNIGSGKITTEEMKNVKHYMIDILNPDEEYSVEEYVKQTKILIKEIQAKNKLPIIVGGTGLYLKALVNNYDFSNTPKDNNLREKYEKIANEKGLDYLYKLLIELDNNRAKQINKNDKKRIIRALEVCNNKNNIETKANIFKEENIKYVIFALTLDRQKLYEKINKRVDLMFNSGLEKEVKELYNSGLNENNQSMKGIGYKEFIPYFKGEKNIDEIKDLIKQHSRNYAKRQLTWLRGMDLNWIDVESIESAKTKIKEEIQK